jgi:hypothetical protein
MNSKSIQKIIPSALLLIAGCKDPGDLYFTGTIEYAYSYTSDSLNVDSLSAARPAKGFFRYDENYYQSRFIGADTNTYYYSGASNKCVSASGVLTNYACEDYGASTDSVLSFKLYDTEEKILGYNCIILEMQKTRSWVKYYVSKEIKMSPVTYRLHRAYNWDFYGEKAGGGMVLKLEHSFKSFTMSGIAIGLKEHDADFKALEIDEIKFAEICNIKK